jgi:hypothetical protein
MVVSHLPQPNTEDSKMALKQIGPNQTQVTYSDGSEVFWSYETPVAGKLPDGTYVKTSTKWSRTTSRHINKWLDGVDAVEVSQDTFTDLVELRGLVDSLTQ